MSFWIKLCEISWLVDEIIQKKLLTVKNLTVAKHMRLPEAWKLRIKSLVSCRELTKSTKPIRLPIRVLEAYTAGGVVELTIH